MLNKANMETKKAAKDIEDFCRVNYYHLLQPFNRNSQVQADWIRLINFYQSMRINFEVIDVNLIKNNISRISYENLKRLDHILLIQEKKLEKVKLKNFETAAKLRDEERIFWEEHSNSFHEDIFLKRNCVGTFDGKLYIKPDLMANYT
jgi:hypothetical protein